MSTRDFETPLHELCALAQEQGLAVDFSIYNVKTDVYEGGARITGADDPMDSIRAGVRGLKARAKETS